jgi:tRNA modification GTPase
MSEPLQPTIAAILTPPGRGAIATVAVKGPQAASIVEQLFSPATPRQLTQRPLRDILYGRWLSTNEEIVVSRSQHDRVEIHCHGGIAASKAIINSLVAAGCIALTWQEFVARDEPNRIRAAAHIALAYCRTRRTATIVLDQYNGALEEAIRHVESLIARQQTASAIQSVETLLSRARLGLHLASPWHIVIAGPPNVGKSSLINALLGYERAIVFDQPGTTRDVVTALAAFDGWPVELSDTAGLCDSRDPLERAGVAKAQQRLRQADLIVLVFDRSQRWTDSEQLLADQWPAALVVHNKIDLVPDACGHESGSPRPSGIELSALTGHNISQLIDTISSQLVPYPPAPRDAVPFTAEQVSSLQEVLKSLQSGSLDLARRTLATTVNATV